MEKQVEAPIFEIQRFSIHDGPGIRTLVFFKGCHLSCKWCQNPESQDTSPVVAFYRERCKESFDCRVVCPENAILNGRFRINYEKCTACGKCVEACAYGALRLIGNRVTPEALFSKILLDLPYYQKSGGGVTFSGGEPTLYPDFLDQTLILCQEKGIHTVLETCGTFSFNIWEPILRKLDLIYFDLKVIDSQDHKQATGVPNTAILKNAKRLVKWSYPVEFRMPLVQGYTDTEENLHQISHHLKEMGQSKIHLLKYHNMGETKIDIIQGSQEKMNLPSYPDQRFEKIKVYFSREGIEVSHL
ncbi:MAG: glycyl-radical enzyme activating protein [Chloroflexi bacterium]|nr:glycyl-radical enzyme activating protein [Chloroflexota bacterium]